MNNLENITKLRKQTFISHYDWEDLEKRFREAEEMNIDQFNRLTDLHKAVETATDIIQQGLYVAECCEVADIFGAPGDKCRLFIRRALSFLGRGQIDPESHKQKEILIHW